MTVNDCWKGEVNSRAHRLPLCLAVVVLGMWMGSFRAPRRWTVRSWITSRMCLIQSCLFSILEAWGATHQRVRRDTFTGSMDDQTQSGCSLNRQPRTKRWILNEQLYHCISSHGWFDLRTCARVTPPCTIDCKMTTEFRQEDQKWPPIISYSASPSPRDTTLQLWGHARPRLRFPFSLSNKQQHGCSGSGLHKTQIRRENGCAQTRNGTANVQSFHSPPFVLLSKNETFLTHSRNDTKTLSINSEGSAARRISWGRAADPGLQDHMLPTVLTTTARILSLSCLIIIYHI